MTQQTPDEEANTELGSVAGELKQESDKLKSLAEKLEAKEEMLFEMESNYPYFRQFVYGKLREEFERTLDELPDTDLETLAKKEGAQPLEAFINELEFLAIDFAVDKERRFVLVRDCRALSGLDR